MKEGTNLILVGINHKSTTLEEREIYQLGRKELPNALRLIRSSEGVEEILILSTCNRMEFYMVISKDYDALDIIREFYYNYKLISIPKKSKSFYIFNGMTVTRHLFKVISGLDSLVLGEYQIQGQVKEAYSIACEQKTVDKILHKLFHAAFRAGKKVRSLTTIGEGRQSVAGVASSIFIENLNNDEVISIIGVNENTTIIAQSLKKNGFKNFIFLNRTQYKAEKMAIDYGGRAFGLDYLEKALFEASAVFTSTSAQNFIIPSEMLKRLFVQERCPKIIVDMAIPRDVDIKDLPKSISYWDIEQLKNYLSQRINEKQAELPNAEKIIEDEVNLFKEWSENLDNKLLEPYSEKFEIVRQQLIEEFREQLSDDELLKADKLTKKLMHRLQSVFIKILLKQEE